MGLLDPAAYPALTHLINVLDAYLQREHPTFFGAGATHPVLAPKRSKVIHDTLWGTNRFSWRELALIDCPLMQRLRDIHQVGLAFQVYPSAHHTRFDHCLGVVTIASRVFDSLVSKSGGNIRDIAGVLYQADDRDETVAKFRQELRLAALLHDTGHSLFSHASERVYENLSVLKNAAKELAEITAKRKGAGEALSFCLALTPAVKALLERPKSFTGADHSEDYDGPIDLLNVALLIVGRSTHPFLQFLGDVVSSGFDADKLDYLLRDAEFAGLPLRYDLDRYLYSVRLEKERLVDELGFLRDLYKSVAPVAPDREPAPTPEDFEYYDANRVRLPRQAMNAIEQIVICKLMLYSYIYHHKKVRAAEGALSLMLQRQVEVWRAAGETDERIVERFIDMTDATIRSDIFIKSSDPIVREYAYRITNRLLPREVLRLSNTMVSGTDKVLVTRFIEHLQEDRTQLAELSKFEMRLAQELHPLIGTEGESHKNLLHRAGVWVDIPKAPKFEDVDKMVVKGAATDAAVQLTHLFPIRQWTEAYEHYRYFIRIFAFSEFKDEVARAAEKAIRAVAKIENKAFYDLVLLPR